MDWKKLWKIHAAPRVKHFIWVILDGRISTTDYLNSINLGPRTLYVLYNLELQIADHLFPFCSKAHSVWNTLNANLGLNIAFPDNISSGAWISDCNFPRSTVCIIATTIWFLWKSRCDAIFNNITPNYSQIINRAIAHVKDFLLENAKLRGRRLLLNNFS